MNYEPAIRVLRDYACKSRQAASRSSDAGFPGNSSHCRDLAASYDAGADLLQKISEGEERGSATSPWTTASTRKLVGTHRSEDSFLSALGGILG
jgi:hypothetical protein